MNSRTPGRRQGDQIILRHMERFVGTRLEPATIDVGSISFAHCVTTIKQAPTVEGILQDRVTSLFLLAYESRSSLFVGSTPTCPSIVLMMQKWT